jgi:acetate kinase
MNVLVINCGSTSVKYAVFDSAEHVLLEGQVERVDPVGGHDAAIARILTEVGRVQIDAVGHRVVHGGPDYHDSVLIDDEVRRTIEGCVSLAPLHNPANLAGIRAVSRALPDVLQVAVFDTAFHARLPRRARTYAIDPEIARRHRIKRYGFHGTSHQYVAGRAAEHLGRPLEELRLVTLHLGGGASACAVEFGQSVDTSLGFTPLEGLVMGSRSGDLDPGIVLELLRDRSLSVEDVEQMLNRRSGLAGLSGISSDLRDIEEAAADGDDRARMAIAVFAHRVRRYIGAFVAVMGGVDAIVLTGGIGENATSMRRRILQRLDFLGLVLDEGRNLAARVSDATPVAEISTSNSRTRALVVRTNEELMIARETRKVAGGSTAVATAGPIPIAISARHVHLDRETFERLFGEGAVLTKYKDISQPGQYAAEQRVDLIGPRARIDGVRVLGPLRARNQVEVSRSDEFKLGVDAPIRRSGHTGDSAPITLQGPKGTVELGEGMICAQRHVHMTPEDAESYGVENGDQVEIAIVGGPRDLIFGDVLIRVSPSYVLEMHIDTDEGNAAELSPAIAGELVYTAVSERMRADIRSRKPRVTVSAK